MTLNEVIATAKDAGFDGVILEMIAHTYKLGEANEREACAKVCEWYSVSKRANINYSEECAEAIRARGEA